MPSRCSLVTWCCTKVAGPSQATSAWTTLPEGVFEVILDKLCQRFAAARSTCKAWKASVSLHQKSLASTLSYEKLLACATAFPKLQSLRVELNSSRVVLDDFFSTLSALSQLQTLALGVFGASLGARELSQLPGSIRQLILSHASVSTEGLIQLPSLAQLRELDVRDCNGSPHQQGLLDVLPELKSLEVLGVGMCWSHVRDWEVKQRMFWDTLCRLSGLTALKLNDYSVPPGKRMFPNGPNYPAGLKHFELLRGRLYSCHFTRMLSGFPQLDSLVVADSETCYSCSSRGADEDLGRVSLSLRGAVGLTSLCSTFAPLRTLESLSLKELRLARTGLGWQPYRNCDICKNSDIYSIARLQQLTRLELEHVKFEGRAELLMSLNLKELVLKKTMSNVCLELLVPVRPQHLEYLQTSMSDHYAKLLVRGSLQSLEVLDLRTMFELPTDISHEVAVAIMLLPELRILAATATSSARL